MIYTNLKIKSAPNILVDEKITDHTIIVGDLVIERQPMEDSAQDAP
jgi:hypothetical protein